MAWALSKFHKRRFKSKIGLSLMYSFFVASSVVAQPIPDASLGAQSSLVLPLQSINGTPSYRIEKGAIRGSNLFHSFQGFDIRSGEGVYFANPVGVNTIFARVTGESISRLDGVLGVLGSSDLFLVNPKGIVFGPDARLDLGGSFLGTTATSIQFADGIEFSALQGSTSPLLTSSIPTGLQMGQNPAAIQVQGMGHRRALYSDLILPFISYEPYAGLQVNPYQSLGLVAGNLDLSGAVLQAPSGKIDLATTNSLGLVRLQKNQQGFSVIDPGANIGSIVLNQKSSLEVGGLESGRVQIYGEQVSIKEGSLIVGENFGPRSAGTISVVATEGLTLEGSIPELNLLGGIFQDNFGDGKGGDIVVQTPNFLLRDGSTIFSRNYGSGLGGSVRLSTDHLTVSGYALTAPELFTRLGTLATSSGKGGDLTIVTRSLDMSSGSFVGTVNVAEGGGGGNVFIDADVITVQGISPVNFSTTIGANNLGRVGFSGDLNIKTRILTIKDGGLLGTATLSGGRSGDLSIEASKLVEVAGAGSEESYTSAISTAVTYPLPIYQRLFNLDPIPSAEGGDIFLRTPSLIIKDYGSLSVANYGTGKAGSLIIESNQILLDNLADIAALSVSGNGGNISIKSDQILLLNSSGIFASAVSKDNTGNGGNIKINSQVILGFNNSDILANSGLGNGGSISLSSQNVFGLKFRDRLTSGSDISASSEFGLDGDVNINMVGADRLSSLFAPNISLAESDQKMTVDCRSGDENQVAFLGKGGLPYSPATPFNAMSAWLDVRPISQDDSTSKMSELPSTVSAKSSVSMATGLQRLENGTIQLVDQSHLVELPVTRPVCIGDK